MVVASEVERKQAPNRVDGGLWQAVDPPKKILDCFFPANFRGGAGAFAGEKPSLADAERLCVLGGGASYTAYPLFVLDIRFVGPAEIVRGVFGCLKASLFTGFDQAFCSLGPVIKIHGVQFALKRYAFRLDQRMCVMHIMRPWTPSTLRKSGPNAVLRSGNLPTSSVSIFQPSGVGRMVRRLVVPPFGCLKVSPVPLQNRSRPHERSPFNSP